MINREVFLPIKDYFKTLEGRDIAWDFIVPCTISAPAAYIVYSFSPEMETMKSIGSSYMNFGAILMGFAIACFTIFATSSNPNVEEIRTRETDKKSRGQNMTLYQVLLAGFMFIIVLSTLGLLSSFAFFLSSILCKKNSVGLLILLAITTFLFLSAIFLIVRNMTNFYHILWKKAPLKEDD